MKEHDLHKDVGVEVLSPGDELSAELRVVSRILAEKKQLSHVLATNDRSLLCVHRIREEIKKRPFFQFAWTKFKCVAPSEELPPLQLAEGFLLLTRDVAELLAKLSDSGRRALDVAALLPLLSVTTLDDQTRLASPQTTSEHIQMLYDQTKSRAFPSQADALLPEARRGAGRRVPGSGTPPHQSRRSCPPQSRPGDLPQSRRGRRGGSSRRNNPRNRCQKSRLWSAAAAAAAGSRASGPAAVSKPRASSSSCGRTRTTLGDTSIAQHDDDAPREPKLAPENDDDDTCREEAEAWLDQGKVPEGDWLTRAGVENDVSGDESDDDQGDDGVNLDTEGDDEPPADWAYERSTPRLPAVPPPPRLRGTDDRLKRLQKMREKLLGAETAAKLEQMTCQLHGWPAVEFGRRRPPRQKRRRRRRPGARPCSRGRPLHRLLW